MKPAEIECAARAGFLSRPIWNEFIATGAARWRRRCWRALRTSGIFLPHPSRFARDVLVLDRRNDVVRELVTGGISAAPFVAQIEHDEEVLRGLFRLERCGLVEGYSLEAEMKRHELKNRVPSAADRAKYPDAIVTLKGRREVRRVAFELEMSLKSYQRYRQMVEAYSSRVDVDAVIFICRFTATGDYLRRAMREGYYPDDERPMGFCDLHEWKKDPATAPIRFATRVQSLASFSL